MMGNNMKEYTVEQRSDYARSLPIEELIQLVEQYGDPTPGTMEAVIYDVLNAEVERRILNWEACVV
jgi:hypothetical protein